MSINILCMENTEGEIVSVEFSENLKMRQDILDLMHKWGLTHLEVKYSAE